MENLRELKGKSEVNETNVQQRMLEAEEKVLSLQEVIKKLQTTKKFLHLNAVEVKASIHSNISRLLESMRSREVWLLNQVDMILEAKEVGLRHQEDQLNRAIGQLSNCLNIMDGGAALNSELNDLLCKIDSVGKHPVESPHISFRADIGSLRHAILEFGRVDSRRLPLEAFASPHLRCSSLPQPFEDYEDDEHHVFHKSVHEIHEKKHGRNIIFNIPKLSADIPSWVSPIHSSAELASPSGMKSDFDVDAKLKSDHRKQTTACSVSQWMQEMKMEDEDDELLAPQFSSRFGSKGIVGSASTSCLLLGSLSRNSPAVGDISKDRPHLRSDCFPFLSSRIQDWLIDGENRVPKSKLAEDRERLFAFEPCVFKPSMDSSKKENVLESCMKKIAALPAHCWLAPSAESAKLESEAGSGILDDYARKIALLPWLISSRGLTKDSEKDSGREHEMGIIETYARKIASLKWLVDEEEGPVDDEHREFDKRQNIILAEAEGILEAYARKLDSKTWVLKKSKSEEEKMSEDGKSFLEHMKNILQMSPNSWLLSDQDNNQTPSLEFDNKVAAADDDDGVKDTDSSNREAKQFTFEGKLRSSVSLDKYICSLNSFPIDHWLISTPAGNVSEPNEFE